MLWVTNFSETRSDKYVFSLDSYKKDRSYFADLVQSSQTSNIFVFIGHVCELRRYLITAYQEGSLAVTNFNWHFVLFSMF